MKIDLGQFRNTFLLESAENATSMETGLLQLRSTPDDIELLNSIFRAAHSIKGGAGSFGFTNLVRFTHTLENLLDRLRSLELNATEDLIELLLRAVDVLRTLLNADADTTLSADALALEGKIGSIASGSAEQKTDGQESVRDAESVRGLHLYRIHFYPDKDLFASGTNPLVLLRNLAEMGTVSCCHVHTDKLPGLADLDPNQCYLSWEVELGATTSEAELREVFEFVEHLAEIRIERLDRDLSPENSVSVEDRHPVPQEPAPASSLETRLPHAPKAASGKKASPAGESGSIRVAIDKVDRLIDLVGELVIAHVMAAQMVEDFEPSCLPKLREAVAAMERNTRELHERVMSVRMLPVGTLFQRYTRTVYDIGTSTGKQINLRIEGEETEIDKGMLELLADPLTHLIRNAGDHGIEAAEARQAAGKELEGLITLNAYHRAGRIVIEVSDDGAGIDTERVRAKAIERGLISPDAQVSDDQLQMLIFEPGFSTKEAISDLSGRGVGMDVVHQNIRQLNGTVSLTSERGRGTKVVIELPLTLAILEGLLVRVEERTLVIPLLSVVETVPLGEEQIERVASLGEVVVIRGESIPLLHLRRFLGLSPDTTTPTNDQGGAGGHRLAVIVEAGQKKVGLVVDELLGIQQVVVKSLERHLRKIDGLMGATILGDGCVAPIVDVAEIATLNLFSLQTRSKVPLRGTGSTPTAPRQRTGQDRGGTIHVLA